MRNPSPSDALRLFLIASLGLPAYACSGSTSSADDGDGDGDVSGDGDGDSSGDGDSTGDGDATGDGDGDGPIETTQCTNPSPWVGVEDTGFVLCEEGFIQRTEQVDCPSTLPRDIEFEPLSDGMGGFSGLPADECLSDADCEGPLAYCGTVSNDQLGGSYRACLSSCVSDADCGDGYVCLCGAGFGTCTPGAASGAASGCNTEADCADGEMCAAVFHAGACGPGSWQFSCTPLNLDCDITDASCTHAGCSLQGERIVCQPNAVCGRPFLVEHQDRKAERAYRDDWCAPSLSKGHCEASVSERAVAAEYFQRVALMEHASIAAFARFNLQLLSLGAPAAFIEATNQALVDETKHARLAFALASRFGGRALGPSSLDVAGALGDDSPEAVLTTTILEGCVGETMAALEARAALERCEDEQVRIALEQIARDESRHAQLAWRVVHWMLRERPELRPVAGRVFASARARSSVGADIRRTGAPALGVLGGRELARVHGEALDRVVLPCAQTLFSSFERKGQFRSGRAAV